MPVAYAPGGLVKVDPASITGVGVPPTGLRGELGQQYFDLSTAPPTEYVYNGTNWSVGGNEYASPTAPGIVQLSDDISADYPSTTLVPTVSATKDYVDGIAIAGAPVATTTTAGIGQLATDAEAIAGTPSTGLLALFVTPSNLAPVLASPPAIGGSAPAAGSFTGLTADGTGVVNLASSGDVTLSSATGSLVVSMGESAADAVKIEATAGGIDILASGAAAGEDIDIIATGSSVNIRSTENAADSITITSTVGGIDILASGAAAGEDIDIIATGSSVNISATESAADSITIISTAGGIDILASGAAAGEDIDIVATGSSVNISATENDAGAIYIRANGGTSERVRLHSDQGTGVDSVILESDVGGITLLSGLASADAINITSTNGGVDIDGALQINIASSQNAANSIVITSSAGGIDILAAGAAAGEDIDIVATGSSVNISSTESVSDSITIVSTAGGIDILASGAAAGEDIDIVATGSSVNISATESAADSITIVSTAGGIDILASGAAAGEDIDIIATGSSVNIQATESDANAITINASGAAGGINVDAGTSGVIVDTTGAISLDSAAASNFTVTGAFDLTLSTTAGSANITAGEDAADAIVISAGAGGIDILATGAAGQDIDIVNTGGSVNITATESAADSIVITSTTGGIDILASGAAAGEDIDIIATGSSVNISATESAADSITIISTAGGIDISASGAAAGEDIDITATGSSINITATENVTDAIVINASGAASALQLDAGTGSIRFGTGWVVPVTSKSNADTPYTVLGTDYFIACDTSAGVLTVTLPAATALAGRTFVIRDVGGAAGVNNITISGGGTNLVGGGAAAATKVLSANYSGATVYSNGTIWAYAYIA